MGYFDKMRDKATVVARTRGESIGTTVDKAAAAVNRRTGGKHADKVGKFAAQAKRKVDEFGEKPSGDTRGQGDGPPPEGPPVL
jgi:hypothetical protein